MILNSLKSWFQTTVVYITLGSWNLVSAILSFLQKNQNISTINKIIANNGPSLKAIDKLSLQKLYDITILQNKFSIINLIIAASFFTALAIRIIKKGQRRSPPQYIYNFLSKKLS